MGPVVFTLAVPKLFLKSRRLLAWTAAAGWRVRLGFTSPAFLVPQVLFTARRCPVLRLLLYPHAFGMLTVVGVLVLLLVFLGVTAGFFVLPLPIMFLKVVLLLTDFRDSALDKLMVYTTVRSSAAAAGSRLMLSVLWHAIQADASSAENGPRQGTCGSAGAGEDPSAF